MQKDNSSKWLAVFIGVVAFSVWFTFGSAYDRGYKKGMQDGYFHACLAITAPEMNPLYPEPKKLERCSKWAKEQTE